VFQNLYRPNLAKSIPMNEGIGFNWRPGEVSVCMVRRGTGFDTDQTRRKLLKERQDIPTLQLPADHHLARNINPVHLEYGLRNIQTNRANFAHGRLPATWFALTQPPYGTSMPQSGRRPQH
jgi:hypothetical protein